MHRLFVVAIAATSLVATVATADAASRHKRHHQDRALWGSHVSMRPVGPPWASPNQCFTDEGYGRFSPCDGSRR